MMALNRMEAPTTTSPSSEKSKEVAPFLKNLRKMLDVESDEILRWTPNGRAFEIHDMEQMMDYVLPKYFKHRKYTSFQRQLNYFNFKKWTKSKAVVCTFSNEYFLRDQPDLAWRISRKKSTQLSGLKSHPSARKAAQVSPAMSMKRLEMGNYGSFRKPVDMAIMNRIGTTRSRTTTTSTATAPPVTRQVVTKWNPSTGSTTFFHR